MDRSFAGSLIQIPISGSVKMSFPSNFTEICRRTRVLKIDGSKVGQFIFKNQLRTFLDDWEICTSEDDHDFVKLQEAARLIKKSDVPVAFPTETVYGLGADATRSSAVRGIYKAKQRPSDNPLIVHISSLSQLSRLFTSEQVQASTPNPIPKIYHALIERFWPGPLTILLPLPNLSPFAPEVTTNLPTVGIRMPSSRLALALIQMAGVPLAAPSANASTKPSPTTAAHVLHDLDGRIDLILDGGACQVGVESTVVDGLSRPPLILRPGGVPIDALRLFPGWEDVRIGYKDVVKSGDLPRAPGMKYKHYSPKARVLLFQRSLSVAVLQDFGRSGKAVGILTTSAEQSDFLSFLGDNTTEANENLSVLADDSSTPLATCHSLQLDCTQATTTIWSIKLGPAIVEIARGLFSALRELDSKGVSIILVESVDEENGDAAAAVMNRLRKAAESEIKT